MGQINNTYGSSDDLENYINWMKYLNYGRDYVDKDKSFTLLLNFFNFIGFGYDFSFKVLIPIITIFVSLLSLFLILPQSGISLINSYFLLLPSQIIQENLFITLRHGLAISFSFLSISLIYKFYKNKSVGLFSFKKINFLKIFIIVFGLYLSLSTHSTSFILYLLLISSIFLDFIFNIIIKKIKFLSFNKKYFIIHLSILIGIIYFNYIANLNFSLSSISIFSFIPPLYKAIEGNLILLPIDELKEYVQSAPIHRPIIYSIIFIYFYFINSILRFKFPTSLNKFNYILSIFSLMCLAIAYSPISIIFPVVVRLNLYAIFALAINSGTIFYRINNINLNYENRFIQSTIKKTTLILIHIFSLYLIISFINN